MEKSEKHRWRGTLMQPMAPDSTAVVGTRTGYEVSTVTDLALPGSGLGAGPYTLLHLI
jgi:hypothetical protein